MHPFKILVHLLIGAISALFLALTLAYLYSRWHADIQPIRPPAIFLWNTVLLIGASLLLIKAKAFYRQDEHRSLQYALALALLLSLLFLIGQGFGWAQLLAVEIPVQHSIGTSYLYLISGLHFVHILIGIPFLINFLWRGRKRLRDPVSRLIYFSDGEEEMRLKLINTYWHFLDLLWIYLVMFFAANSLL